ncbi:hypothetical protein [Massilia rubra]|uniref:Thioredoxin domain-containing protein n=1 Tax=Massilia rubra TaxID=2607910 RepID=A0ABX0LM19_9BURK|nr:hypothetical protein [Massilia rubra]NHZ33511.1 hypothetical protein [Massilia rubra]
MKESIWPKILVWLSLCGYCSSSCAAMEISSRLENFIAKTDAVSTSGKPTEEKASLINAEYMKNFATDAAAIPDNELAAFFEATQYVMFYTLDRSKLSLFEMIFARLINIHEATSEQSGKLLQMYYALREFEKANSFIERYGRHPLQARPIIIKDLTSPSSTRTIWNFHPKRTLTRLDMGLQKGRHLVIIGSPYCPFATRAFSEIESSPMLAPLLPGRVTVMAMPDFNFDYDSYTRWNQSHPSLPFTLTHRREEWPEVSHWVSPLFLFFRDGKLESKFSGWDKDGNLGKIYEGFGIAASSDFGKR